MSRPTCPNCDVDDSNCTKIRRHGSYFRTSDQTRVQRYHCHGCGHGYSEATGESYYRKRERTKSRLVSELLASGMSLRRMADFLKTTRRTIERVFLLDAFDAEARLFNRNRTRGEVSLIEFDDLETFEHTKCKPLSVTLAVESKTRVFLGLQVSQMPARGRLAAIARKKYGRRIDTRKAARERLLRHLENFASTEVAFKSDLNPHYAPSLQKFFPNQKHFKYRGRKATATGLGELKEGGFDPLFSVNHSCAMLRANINRLFRQTWCTTKRADRLRSHLMIYADYHNADLAKREEKKLARAQLVSATPKGAS